MMNPEFVFEAHSGGRNYSLVQYRFPRKTLGFFFTSGAGGADAIRGIPDPIDIIARLYTYRAVLRVAEILRRIHAQDPELLSRVHRSYYDLLSIYVEQRRIKPKFLIKELGRYERSDLDRKTISR